MQEQQITLFSQKNKEERVIKISIDKFLLGVIFLLLAAVAIFYAGIKVGQEKAPRERLSKPGYRQTRRRTINPKTAEKQAGSGNKIKADVEPKEAKPAEERGRKASHFFTIQLATYSEKNELIADRNIQLLKGKGIKAFKIRKGSYIALCAGKFDTRQDAQRNLAVLRKDYHDCFIKEVGK